MACALVAVAVGLSGCTAAESPQPTEQTTTARKPLFEDTGLRDVRMTSGRALGYVQPETASQILCQSLDKDAWERLLGDPVGRKPLTGSYSGCSVATADQIVTLELSSSDEALEPNTTIAGRPARNDAGIITVALTDDALRPAPRQNFRERRLLEANVTTGDSEKDLDLAQRVLEEIVPLVVEKGEELPAIDGRGHLRYVDTPVTEDFVDLPTPVQALQLCTIMREEPGVSQVEVREDGHCVVSVADDTFSVATRHGATEYPDRVAGRPARTSDIADAMWAEVRLRDDAATTLWVNSDNAVELAEKLVPLLTK